MNQSVNTVTTNQQGIHQNLEKIVQRHLAASFKKPIADFNRAAFDDCQQWLQQFNTKLIILDSCCGKAESTAWLAKQYPDLPVIGLDQSAHRLEKHCQVADNYYLVRAHYEDFWRLAQAAGWQLHQHSIFYPNPYPKSIHLQRRIHASPVWPTLIALGGQLLLRSNWLLYLQEAQFALQLVGINATLAQLDIQQPITAFERKFYLAGQPLWQLQAKL